MGKHLRRLTGTAALLITAASAWYVIRFFSMPGGFPAPVERLEEAVMERDALWDQGSAFGQEEGRQRAAEGQAGRGPAPEESHSLPGVAAEVRRLKRSGPPPLDPDSERRKLEETAARAEEAYRHYHGGDYDAGSKALLDLVDYLQAADAESDRPGQNTYALDAMVSYVRLASLEEKQGGSQADEYMGIASALCRGLNRPWGDCLQDLRRNVDLMDQVQPSRPTD